MSYGAFFCSTSVVTVLMPLRNTLGRLLGWSGLPAARCSARSFRRVFFSTLDSGRYLSSSLNSWVAGCRCSLMYLGQRTNLLRSRLGWMFWPMPKLRGRFSNSGFTVFLASTLRATSGAAATFFLLLGLGLVLGMVNTLNLNSS